MPIDSDTLSSLALDFAKSMTSIRGRRVQRLLKREFSGAEHVLIVQTGAGAAAVLALSATGASYCATDGRGQHAAVFTWPIGSTEALETRYDLLKDSLPVLDTKPAPLADLLLQARIRVAPGSVSPRVHALADQALQTPA